MKKALFLFFIFLISSFISVSARNPLNDTYKEQFKTSGASDLKEKIPRDSAKIMDKIGITGENWEEFSKLTPDKILGQVKEVGKEKSAVPLTALTPILAIILLNALVENIKSSFGQSHIGSVISAVSTLCICICIVTPILKSITSMAVIIKVAAGFMLCYIPVMTGIMIVSGQAASSVPYHIMMMSAGQIISQISANFLVPIMNTALGISVISSISPRMNLSNICDIFHKAIKWILGFLTSIFVGILTIQNIVTASADTFGSRTVKFALNSFVPIVGGALSDAFGTVQGCVRLLKSGVGAFGIIAGAVIFMPLVIECIAWIAFLGVCAEVGTVFELKQISGLLRSTSKVMSTMLAVILSCMMVLIVSTVLVLMIGGNAT